MPTTQTAPAVQAAVKEVAQGNVAEMPEDIVKELGKVASEIGQQSQQTQQGAAVNSA